MKVGFIGLGRMGQGMAGRLLAAGQVFIVAAVLGRPELAAAGQLGIVPTCPPVRSAAES